MKPNFFPPWHLVRGANDGGGGVAQLLERGPVSGSRGFQSPVRQQRSVVERLSRSNDKTADAPQWGMAPLLGLDPVSGCWPSI
jgi:hypothetical protein